MHQTTFSVETTGPGITDITRDVARWVAGTGTDTGLLTLFLRHTSASLLIQENADPAVRADLRTFLRQLVPPADDPRQRWITHRAEGSDDMPAHIKAALLPVSVQVPVAGGRMLLGTWQGIWLWEHRSRPQVREILGHLA